MYSIKIVYKESIFHLKCFIKSPIFFLKNFINDHDNVKYNHQFIHRFEKYKVLVAKEV